MSAKQQAIKDIKKDFGKSFLAFHTELNQTMRELVRNQINEQKKLKNHETTHRS